MIRKLFWLILIGISLVFLLNTMSFADSLWKENTKSLYGTPRSSKVGDIITIYISESTNAQQEAGTDTSKESSLSSNFFDNWTQVANVLGSDENMRKRKTYDFGGKDKYKGVGKTARKSKVEAVITAMVTEVLDNGNLYVVGERKVKVNGETETIFISGIVRPLDISSNNTIYSYQLAQGQVSVQGSGVVGSKQTPGLLTRIFNWVF